MPLHQLRIIIINASDFASAPTRRVIFGVTFQLAVHHCMPGNAMHLDETLADTDRPVACLRVGDRRAAHLRQVGRRQAVAVQRQLLRDDVGQQRVGGLRLRRHDAQAHRVRGPALRLLGHDDVDCPA